MLVAFRKSTQAVIPDFQSRATREALLKNAVVAGIPEEDVDVRDITPEEAKQLEDAHFAADRAAAEAARASRRTKAQAVKTKLNLTDADLASLADLLGPFLGELSGGIGGQGAPRG